MSRIMNLWDKLLTINLDTQTANGVPDSLHLAPREISRTLTEAEFASREIASLLSPKPKPKIKVLPD